jgi:hypothetical protein
MIRRKQNSSRLITQTLQNQISRNPRPFRTTLRERTKTERPRRLDQPNPRTSQPNQRSCRRRMGIGRARIGQRIIAHPASPQPATSETILSAAMAPVATPQNQARLAASNPVASHKPRAIADRRAWAERTIASRSAAVEAAANPNAPAAVAAAAVVVEAEVIVEVAVAVGNAANVARRITPLTLADARGRQRWWQRRA